MRKKNKLIISLTKLKTKIIIKNLWVYLGLPTGPTLPVEVDPLPYLLGVQTDPLGRELVKWNFGSERALPNAKKGKRVLRGGARGLVLATLVAGSMTLRRYA